LTAVSERLFLFFACRNGQGMNLERDRPHGRNWAIDFVVE